MPILRVALLVLLISLVAAPALADAMGGPCPSGQIFQANPTQPGAMHHAGGQCVPDPSASHCDASPGHAGSNGIAVACAALALALARRRRTS